MWKITAQMAVLKSYEQTFIDAVRATGGNNAVRNLIVQGPSTDIGKTDNLFGDMPTDVVKDRLMVEVHYYTLGHSVVWRRMKIGGGWPTFGETIKSKVPTVMLLLVI